MRTISCNDNQNGYIKTKLIHLNSHNMSINCETFENGYIQVSLLDETTEDTILIGSNICGNELDKKIEWITINTFVPGKI